MVFRFLPAPRPPSSASCSAPAGRDPPIRPPRGPACRLKAGEGLPPKTGEDCAPLKAASVRGPGEKLGAAPSLALPPPLRPPPLPCPARETDKPAAGQTQSHAARAARARPLGLGPGTGWSKPSPPSSPVAPPTSPLPAPNPRAAAGGVAGARAGSRARDGRNGPGARSAGLPAASVPPTRPLVPAPVCAPRAGGGGGGGEARAPSPPARGRAGAAVTLSQGARLLLPGEGPADSRLRVLPEVCFAVFTQELEEGGRGARWRHQTGQHLCSSGDALPWALQRTGVSRTRPGAAGAPPRRVDPDGGQAGASARCTGADSERVGSFLQVRVPADCPRPGERSHGRRERRRAASRDLQASQAQSCSQKASGAGTRAPAH